MTDESGKLAGLVSFIMEQLVSFIMEQNGASLSADIPDEVTPSQNAREMKEEDLTAISKKIAASYKKVTKAEFGKFLPGQSQCLSDIGANGLGWCALNYQTEREDFGIYLEFELDAQHNAFYFLTKLLVDPNGARFRTNGVQNPNEVFNCVDRQRSFRIDLKNNKLDGYLSDSGAIPFSCQKQSKSKWHCKRVGAEEMTVDAGIGQGGKHFARIEIGEDAGYELSCDR